MKLIDMTGWVMKEHGVPNSRLTVIERVENKGKKVMWKCKCSCGKETIINGHSIRTGQILSCGCLRNEKVAKAIVVDLINQRFGKLTVIEKTDKRGSDGSIIWKCRCDCGNECEVNGNYLKNGDTKSCGCIKSKGELKILQLLKDNNIIFNQQKTFENCRFPETNRLAFFDFYIDNKYIIEFDGEQHFKSGSENGWNNEENFKKTQERDKIKNQYCFDHNIPIIRIPYTHLNELCLEDLLLETSKFIYKKEE